MTPPTAAEVLATMLTISNGYYPEGVHEDNPLIIALKKRCGWTPETQPLDLEEDVRELARLETRRP
jgi:hypothetical protein